ncbi:hypothetical protein ES676_05540 [Bizionia saleffrena]|uniref:Uncharacterized protein n=1 Tax=Bizionia saleffrena TaxID=291189 RepID=A0A8H2LNJ4_9FLAO|nr:hypothetical protein [Bizionia saleffrena]TYB76804.1 hypothetical protein ES676_05540 [Bizionia saleffrena]
MKYYTCEYCFTDFEPKRRRVQKYCSDTCRSKAYHLRKSTPNKTTELIPFTTAVQEAQPPIPPSKTKIEAVSTAGIGNAAAGSLLADSLKSIFTPLDNKPATKADFKQLSDKLTKRYHLVKNIPNRHDGALPYFDIETGNVVYLWGRV